jgi:hypothetical protein
VLNGHGRKEKCKRCNKQRRASVSYSLSLHREYRAFSNSDVCLSSAINGIWDGWEVQLMYTKQLDVHTHLLHYCFNVCIICMYNLQTTLFSYRVFFLVTRSCYRVYIVGIVIIEFRPYYQSHRSWFHAEAVCPSSFPDIGTSP